MGLRKLWALVGHSSIAEGSRSRALLTERGVRVVEEEVLAIEPAARAAETTSGRLDADYLVIALGAVSRPDLVSGLADHGHDIWSFAGVPGAAAALEQFDGGRLLILIAGRFLPVPAGAVRVRVPPARLSRAARPPRPDRSCRRHPAADADAERRLGRFGVDGRATRGAEHRAANRRQGRARRGLLALGPRRRQRGAVRSPPHRATASAAGRGHGHWSRRGATAGSASIPARWPRPWTASSGSETST